MLLKSKLGNIPYRKALKIKMWASVIIIMIGLKGLLLVLLNQVGDLDSLTSPFGITLVNFDFMQGFYTGFGCGLIAVGVAIILRSAALLRNVEKYKKAEIEYMDERNRFIRSLTFNTTSSVFLIALAFGVMISGMFNLIVFVTLLGTFVVYLLLLLTTFLVFRSKY